MSSPIERRQMILEYLSDNRQSSYRELAERFGVSKNTIVNDIAELTLSAPIETIHCDSQVSIGRDGGGIRVADGWYLSRRYLHSDQEQLLRDLMDGLQPDQQKVMQSILSAFAKPKVKEPKN